MSCYPRQWHCDLCRSKQSLIAVLVLSRLISSNAWVQSQQRRETCKSNIYLWIPGHLTWIGTEGKISWTLCQSEALEFRSWMLQSAGMGSIGSIIHTVCFSILTTQCLVGCLCARWHAGSRDAKMTFPVFVGENNQGKQNVQHWVLANDDLLLQ